MSDVKQVKVDNWGIYFLQRLKHFFNRTDYCDLTLQFQDNAQLKVHRLVLSACTEYFELLERTCEMYEDCLVMPDDLQADVVVPIVNFMYTGQLEFKMESLERLYQTSLVMNMPVLSKLLHAHRQLQTRPSPVHIYSKQARLNVPKNTKSPVPSSSGTNNKRSFSKAFEDRNVQKTKKVFYPIVMNNKQDNQLNNGASSSETNSYSFPVVSDKNKKTSSVPRPTRYELPEELDEDNIFDNSFTNISYTSKPLMIHPNAVKQYSSKAVGLFEDASTSKRFFQTSSADIVECKKITRNSNIFDDEVSESIPDESEVFQQSICHKDDGKDANQLFDQILDNDGPKLTIEANDGKQRNNIDHAKIISEVLKKYPHLVKSNKNIKLKILNNPKTKKKVPSNIPVQESESVKPKQEPPDFTYESDVIDSKKAAQLIALGAENIKGPWICLICGTPGRALHFTSYFKFRRHLVDVHNEKPILNICEYCGLKSLKRNCILYHLYTKHGVSPPSQYHFPKCNICNYIALTEALLVKHKMSHSENRQFRCNVCASSYQTSNQLLMHIQNTGHKYSAERKTNLQCVYCLKVFLRDSNFYAHLKTTHKDSAINDGIIDDSDDEKIENILQNLRQTQKGEPSKSSNNSIKTELPIAFESPYEECNVQYQFEQKSDSNVQIISKKPKVLMPANKHKILNSDFRTETTPVTSPSCSTQKKKVYQEPHSDQSEYIQEMDTDSPTTPNNEEIVIIDNQEFIVQNYQLIPKKESSTEDYILPTTGIDESVTTLASASQMEYQTIHNTQPESTKMIVKKTNVTQPIQIVVSNEEEYKALMSSNHSIIFDNTDSNKTLTVLTAPNNTQLETQSIDLDNAQSNDMMIIPDNYPINVSESVSADSSNIVVVYSHPVDDQNKQYQIITSQGIEAQFVQTSGILTQNFETVTNCTPVMNAHVLNNPGVESWHNTVQENINKLPIPCTSGMQAMHIPTSIEVTSMENITTDNIEELPEVNISQTQNTPINITQIVTSQTDATMNIYNETHLIDSSVLEPSDNNIMTQQISHENMNIIDQEQQSATPLHLLEQTMADTQIQPLSNEVVNNSTTELSSVTQNEILCEDNIHITDSVIVTNEQSTTSHIDFCIQNADELNNSSELNPENNLVPQTHTSEKLPPNITPDFEKEFDNTPNVETTIANNSNEKSKKEDLNENQGESEIPEPIENIVKDMSIDQSLNEHTETTEVSNDHEENEQEISKSNHSIVDGKDQSIDNETIESVIIKNVTPEREIREDIVTLASEWSEEETDPQQNAVKTCNDSHEAGILNNQEDPEEVEESIENIQQEMEKQAVEYKNIEANTESNGSEKQIVTHHQVGLSPETKNIDKIPPQEKISSLLNDWDDNDSQEEDSGNVETPIGDTSINTSVEENQINENINDGVKVNNCSVIVEPEIKKDDKIKSLVSDWDEEDEEEIKD